jgi:formate hydrogenlyase subunit 6/NADH:ubiquinone oxidoreductase subunit I
MKYPKLRELKEAVKALLKGPYTSNFPAEPHVPAPGFRGRPIPDDKECIGCGACAEVCPVGAIELTDNLAAEPPVRRLTWHYDICIFCGQCERYCTTKKGVKLSPEFDLAALERKNLFSELKKELLLCSCCGELIGPKEHITWVTRRLGPKAYGNVLLTSTLQRELNIVQETVPPAGSSCATFNRTHLFSLFCPKCRHRVLIFDEYGKLQGK